MTATELINLLQLEPLPEEGGFFRRTYESAERVAAAALPPRYQDNMLLGTAIYALFTAKDFSAMHRLSTDEVYHFYYGDPLEMLLLYPDGSGESVLLGDDFAAGMRPQFVAPRDAWQGSTCTPNGPHGFSLIGTTMAPGYEQSSFELGERDELLRAYPDFAEAIKKLTRS